MAMHMSYAANKTSHTVAHFNLRIPCVRMLQCFMG